MSFHKAAIQVLTSAEGPLTPDELAKEVGRIGFRKRNGEPIAGHYVVLGVLNHPEEFEVLIGLKNG